MSERKSKIERQRREYGGVELLEEQAPAAPFALFERWLDEALAAELLDATAMSVATADAAGKVSVRTVLLKQWDETGFVFYTRYNSRKGLDLQTNPHAALLFHWREHSRQVQIRGRVGRLSRAENQAYFASRPRSSQIAAAVSCSRSHWGGRSELEEAMAAAERLLGGAAVPLPKAWGGYRVVAETVEFWQGRDNRLHDRLSYSAAPGGRWQRTRLSP